LKRNSLLSILALVPAALMPLVATCQVAPAAGSGAADRPEVNYKWSAYVGYGYTSINQVDQSRHGLQGVEFSLTRNWGKYFGLMADGAYYKPAIASGNPGDPLVYVGLMGPELHAHLIGRVDFTAHVLLGAEHTGGESETPNISFAGGGGCGLDYALTPRISIRVGGDDILSSFVEDPNHLGYSPHERGNSRATVGLVYKF